MENSRKRNNNHSGGPKWKKLKQESGKLIPGSKGLLITNSITGKYKEAMQEVLFILRQHSDKFYPEDLCDVKPEKVDPTDTELMLKNDLKELNEKFNRFVPGPCISKGLNYVYFKNFKDIPSKYVQEIFYEIKNYKSYSARFLSKMIPVDCICNANELDLKLTLENVISREFPESFANTQNGKLEDQISVNNDEQEMKYKNIEVNGCKIKGEEEEGNKLNVKGFEKEGEEGVTWALDFKSTNSNALRRQQVLDMVTILIGNRYKVDLKSPEKLVIIHVVKDNELQIPREGEWIVCGESGEDSKWFTHESQEWMHNPEERVYFHIKTQTIVPDLSLVELGEKYGNSLVGKKTKKYNPQEYDPEVEEFDKNGQIIDETPNEYNKDDRSDETEEDDFSMDFNKDLVAGSVSRKGQCESKLENEDRYITKECMSIQYVSNSDALCYFSGVFDGHYGPKCSQYAIEHVKNNILTVFRQNIKSSPSWFKKRKVFSKNAFSYKLNEFVSNNTVFKSKNNKLSIFNDRSNSNDSSPDSNYSNSSNPDRNNNTAPNTNNNNKEVDNDVSVLIYSIHKGIEMLDNNFCAYAKKDIIFDGSTLNMVFLYGPDLSGNLKLIAANLGDSRSILCVKEEDRCVAKDLTLDHKPNDLSERERILKSGGTVEYLQNSWRAVLKKKNGIVCALSTSRSLGDYVMKSPNKIISANVDLYIHDFNFNDFLFIVQCTDGIVDVLTSQEVVDLVVECIRLGYEPEKAADEVVKAAEQRGSVDDKTCNIIYFSWNQYFLNKNEDNNKGVDNNRSTSNSRFCENNSMEYSNNTSNESFKSSENNSLGNEEDYNIFDKV